MIRHDDVTQNVMMLRLKIVEPFINDVVTVYDIEQAHRVVTGKCYNKNTITIFNISFCRHFTQLFCCAASPLRETRLGKKIEFVSERKVVSI